MHHDNCITFFRHDPVTKSDVHGKCHNLPLREEAVSRLKRYDPLHIYREGKASGLNLAGYKKYLNQVWLMYNGSSRKNALPQKY